MKHPPPLGIEQQAGPCNKPCQLMGSHANPMPLKNGYKTALSQAWTTYLPRPMHTAHHKYSPPLRSRLLQGYAAIITWPAHLQLQSDRHGQHENSSSLRQAYCGLNSV